MKPGLAKESVVCNLCGSADSTPIGEGTDREYPTSPDVFPIVECGGCGLWYLNPRPAQSELGTIYPSNYHAYNIRSADTSAAELPLVTRLRHRIYSRRFQRVFRYLEGREPIELLDVGCGDGWMLDLYKLAAPVETKTYGVDFSADVCEVARAFGHTVYCSRFEDLELAGRFDAVNLSHVIEHVSDPSLIARKSFDVLKPGGVFVVETPNVDTLDCRWFRKGNWGAYHVPRHWTLFNPATLRKLGEQAGFTFREVSFNPAPVHWVWSFNNVSTQVGGRLGRLGRRVFAPLDVFGGGMKAFMLLSTFTLFDLALKIATGRTSNMMMIFSKGTT
ncbi:MAG: class I SAM-dependent methyltransferase [Steroidobacteraceae bacterium]